MLGAFNEATPDWLSFHMFTFFTDRDGKMQLESLAQSGFDPLSRTCRFMLTEEAHHMFVGETGIGRTLQRTCEAMKEAGIEDPNDIERVRALGVIDLPTMKKKLNLHYSLSLDLFGSEVSTNAANAFNAGIKGRFQETKIDDDHRLENSTYPVLKLVDGEIKRVDEPALTAINMRLRDDYTADCQRGLDRWNKIIERTGVPYKLELPHVGVPPPDRRVQGHQGGAGRRDRSTTPPGIARRTSGCRRADDGEFIQSLMKPVTEPGQFASWIAPPRVGIDNKPGDFEYVKIAGDSRLRVPGERRETQRRNETRGPRAEISAKRRLVVARRETRKVAGSSLLEAVDGLAAGRADETVGHSGLLKGVQCKYHAVARMVSVMSARIKTFMGASMGPATS